MIEVHRTTQAVPGERLLSLLPIPFGPEPDHTHASVQVDDGHRFQTVEGFGGAFTEAAAVTFQKLSPDKQRRLLSDYFDPVHGHGYTLGRTHINSCDFALGNWAAGFHWYMVDCFETSSASTTAGRTRRSSSPRAAWSGSRTTSPASGALARNTA